MLFFSKKDKSGPGLSGVVISFLMDADSAYMYSYSTRDTLVLHDYFSRECRRKIYDMILATASTREFSTPKFRNTTWTLISKNVDGTFWVKKSVVFDAIKVTGAIRMKVAQDYEEKWLVGVTDDRKYYEVKDIEYIPRYYG